MDIQKAINKNKPYRCSDNINRCEGQYNYDSSNGVMPGVDGSKELYSLQHSDQNNSTLIEYPNFIWGYQNTKLKVKTLHLKQNGGLSDTLGETKFAFHIFDDRYFPSINDSRSSTEEFGFWSGLAGGHIGYTGLLWYTSFPLVPGGCNWNDDCTEYGHPDPLYIIENYEYTATRSSWNSDTDADLGWFEISGWSTDDGDIDGWTPVSGVWPATSGANWEFDNFPKFYTDHGYMYNNGNFILDRDPIHWSDDLKDPLGSSLYFVFLLKADGVDNWDGKFGRKKSATIYKLQKRELFNLWKNQNGETITIGWGGDGSNDINYALPDIHEDTSASNKAAYRGGKFEIEITGPAWNQALLPQNDNLDFYYGEKVTRWASKENEDLLVKVRPENEVIDYVNNEIDTEVRDFDFRPISFVNMVGNDYDPQNWYTYENGYEFVTAPANIELSFRIAENRNIWFPEYLGYDPETPDVYTNLKEESNDWENFKFKFFVIDWDTGTEESFDEGFDTIDWPGTYQDLLTYNNQNNTFFETDLVSSSGEVAQDGDVYQTIRHQYETPGVKIIKAMVFTYTHHDQDDDLIQAHRFKLVYIKLHLGVNSAEVSSFQDIKADDYTYIPWPKPAVVIGGISENSSYVRSLKRMEKENKFSETEVIDYSQLQRSLDITIGNKKEMGVSLGKTDISQARYFESTYDMNDLLMINELYDGFVRYDEEEMWFSKENLNLPQYPEDSCVGKIFINDQSNQDLIDKCKIEVNFNDTEVNTINDTSGTGHKAYIFGDYSISKNDTEEESRRESGTNVPDIENDQEQGAF